MSEPGKRADGGVHTWMVCPDCHAGVRASRHSPEDCDSLFALKAELAGVNELLREGSKALGILKTELAEANAKIKAVESLHSREIRYLTESLSVEDCTECNDSFPCYTILAILESATPEPIFIKSESAIVDPEC